MERRTQVAIIGAGPAGLVLANVLIRAGIDCIVVEHRSREHVESRARAGFLEHRTVEYLSHHGLADRLLAEAMRHVRCELRTHGRRFSVPYGRLAGGRAHAVYPQQLLVRDLIELFADAGGEVMFSTPVAEVTGLHERRAIVRCSRGDAITCDFVAGCDGHRGVSRQAVPPQALRTFAKRYPFDWVAVLGEARPAPDQVVYALHENGFAGQMPRTADISRFYLQCPADDSIEHWPDERIWKELRHRLAADGVEELSTGRILEKGILSMRSAVTEPMQFGRLYLAGDSAHVLTPSGAKGMNLAVADAAALAEAIVAHYRDGIQELLAGYTSTRLVDVWQAQEFSDWLVQLLHGPADPDDGFQQQLRLARLSQLEQSSAAAASFARRYVG